MSSKDGNPFRSFSLSVYAEEAVEHACLELQKRCDADVLIVLLCAWLGRHGVGLSRDALRDVDQAASPWRGDVIAPIRAVRKRMKLPVGEVTVAQASGVREVLKSAELQAEFLQIDALYGMMEDLPGRDGRDADRAGLIRGNILRYLGLNGTTGSKVPRDSVEAIVAACATNSSDPESTEDN